MGFCLGLSDPTRVLSSRFSFLLIYSVVGMAAKMACHYAETSPENTSFRLCCESLREGDKIVSVGGDHELLWLRNAVLQSAGFKVLTTEDESTALEQISQMDCGVLLVCYSLPPPVRNRLAKSFREKCPDGRIIAIANRKIEKPEFADAFVYGLEGPETLISTILQG